MKKESWIRWVKKERLNNQRRKEKHQECLTCCQFNEFVLPYCISAQFSHNIASNTWSKKKRKENKLTSAASAKEITNEHSKNVFIVSWKHSEFFEWLISLSWFFFHVLLYKHVSVFYWLLFVHFCINKLLYATLLRINNFSSIIYIVKSKNRKKYNTLYSLIRRRK